MAGVTYTSTFDGDALMEVIARTILAGNAIQDGIVRLHTNVNKKKEIPIAEMGISIQDSSCKFSDDEKGINFTPRYLEPKGFKVNKELCFKNIKDTYFSWLQSRGEEGNYDSTDLMEEFVIDWVSKNTNAFIDASIWVGSANVNLKNVEITATTSVVAGILPGLVADTEVQKISTPSFTINGISKATNAVLTVTTANTDITVGTEITILSALPSSWGAVLNNKTFKVLAINGTATEFTINADTSGASGTYTADSAVGFFINENNVISVLTEAYVNLPEEVEEDPNFAFVTSKQVIKAYKLACAKVANGAGAYVVGDREVDLLGYRLVRASYFPKNTIIASKIGEMGNLHFGTDLESENNDVKVKDMRDVTLDNTYRYSSMWEFDVNHTLGSEILLIKPQ